MKIEAGQVYKTNAGGSATVINYINSGKILVQHNDNYKHQQFVRACNLRSGDFKNPYTKSTKGIGFIGVGEFDRSIKGRMTKSYSLWSSMMQRCYCSTRNKSKKSYFGISVDKEWHNFQNFAQWFNKQINVINQGFDLDKDLRVSGNKMYSKNTCSMVPVEINKMVRSMSGYKRSVPQGVKSAGKSYTAHIGMNGFVHYLGIYKTKEEASEVYRNKKQEYYKVMAEKYKNVLHREVYENLTLGRIE